MRWLDGITDLMDVSLSELQELDREAWRAAIHGVAQNIVFVITLELHFHCAWPICIQTKEIIFKRGFLCFCFGPLG